MAYCDDHKERGECIEKHGEAIAVMQGNNKLLKWLTPIAVSIAIVVVGVVQKQNADNMEKLVASVSRVETIVQQAAITAAANGTRLDYLEREVIKGHSK